MTLQLVPARWYSWDFRVLSDGRELTRIDRQSLRERGAFTLEGSEYEVRRTSVVRGTFVLQRNGVVLAEATKPSALRRRFEITAGLDRYTVEAVSAIRREFRLLRRSMVVGTVAPVSIWSRKATARFVPDVPLELQIFAVFLVLILWKRASDSDSG